MGGAQVEVRCSQEKGAEVQGRKKKFEAAHAERKTKSRCKREKARALHTERKGKEGQTKIKKAKTLQVEKNTKVGIATKAMSDAQKKMENAPNDRSKKVL